MSTTKPIRGQWSYHCHDFSSRRTFAPETTEAAIKLVDQYFLCGLFNSFVVNYLVRLRVSTHVTTALVERLPVPTREQAPHA